MVEEYIQISRNLDSPTLYAVVEVRSYTVLSFELGHLKANKGINISC